MNKIIAVCISEIKGTQKTEVPFAEMVPDWGIKGDAHPDPDKGGSGGMNREKSKNSQPGSSKTMKKKTFRIVPMLAAAAFLLTACTGVSSATASTAASSPSTASATAEVTDGNNTEVIVFAAASLTAIMEDFERDFESQHPNVDIVLNTDSSGKLLAQIREGAPCDIFFSAGQSQVNTLEKEGMLINGTRKNVVNNQLVVITQPDSTTKVTGLEDLDKASGIALADGIVPVGKYTRIALMKLGILPETDKPEDYTTQDISDALGGVEISEQGNVSKVRTAVEEGSCEVGTAYYSDIYRHEDRVRVLQVVSYDISGNIIYPVCMVKNEEADADETAAAGAFLDFITDEKAKALYTQYLFVPDVQ